MKFLLGIALALGVSAVAYAAAANLVVQSGTLQQGTDLTLACTETATVNYQNNSGMGNADIVITGLDEDCIGANLYVRIFDANNVVLYNCPADAGSEPDGTEGGIEITAATMNLQDAGCPDPGDTLNIAAADSVQVTIVGGGTTETTNPAP